MLVYLAAQLPESAHLAQIEIAIRIMVLVAAMLPSKLSTAYLLLRRLIVVGKDGTFNFFTDAVIIMVTLWLIAFIPWPLHIPLWV